MIDQYSMNLRADNLQDPLEAMDAIRNRVCNGFLFTLAAAISIGMVAGVSRAFDIGSCPIVGGNPILA